MVFDREVCPWFISRGELAVVKSHLRQVAHEHAFVRAIGIRAKEDISSVVGQALRADGSCRERYAPEGLDGEDIELHVS